MAARVKKHQWPNLYSRAHRSGQTGYMVDLGLVDGRRKRVSFKTKAEAQTFAEQKRIERMNEGTSALSLSQETRVDAAKADQLLKPHGVSLEEAANYYLTHVVAFRLAPKTSEIIQRILVDAEKNNRRDRTITDLRNRMEKFAEDFGDRQLNDLTLEELEDWIDEPELSARTRINYLTKISQLYNYALKRHWVDQNLVERIERPSVEDKEPGIFSIRECKALLENAGVSGLLPYISIGLFAGVRSAELLRLDTSAVKMGERSITVGQEAAKRRSRRAVDMCDALFAWLSRCELKPGPIADARRLRDNIETLKAAAGIGVWPQNGLRHSFASYHLAAHGDAMKTASQMGHMGTDVIHNHYKALVTKADAQAFWNLTPEAPVVEAGVPAPEPRGH